MAGPYPSDMIKYITLFEPEYCPLFTTPTMFYKGGVMKG